MSRQLGKYALLAPLAASLLVAGILLGSVFTGTAKTVTQTKTMSGQVSQIGSSSVNQTSLNFPQNATFKASGLPQVFIVGGYHFRQLCNSECSSMHNGTTTVTMYLGHVMFLNVSRDNENQTLSFGWGATGQTNIPPTRPSASALDGKVNVNWFTNSSGLYVSIFTEG